MTPLEEIGLGWRSHKVVLEWLWLLYRRPGDFHKAVDAMLRLAALRAGGLILFHSLPWVFLIVLLSRLAITPWVAFDAYGIAYGIAVRIAYGIVVGIAVGISVRIAAGIAVGIAGGIAFGIAGGIAAGIAVGIGWYGIAYGIAFGIAGGIAGGMAVGIAGGIAGGIAVGIAYGISGGITHGIAAGIAAGIAVLRAYYVPPAVLSVWPRVRPEWYHNHPAAWDNMCSIPYPRLSLLLVAYAERHSETGEAEIERIIDEYPAQAGQALRARTILLARRVTKESSLIRLPEVTAKLPGGSKGYLAQTEAVHEAVVEIARMQTRLDTIDRAVFREPTAELLVKEIENFRHRLAGFAEPLKSEFRRAAEAWEQLARRQLEEIRAQVKREPIGQFFRAGDPVDRNKEAFVPRHQVTAELEQQVMLGTGCPGVILYGRRRVGKSTVLKNLDGFLPLNVRVAYLSAQSPELFTSTASLVAAIGGAVNPEAATPDDLKGLFRLLTEENARLEAAGKRLVLALDEYEMLDRKIGEGVFSQDLLEAMRDSMQSHRSITWVLAGSHQITELAHAPWTSYLVSARLIQVPVFTEAETRLLLTAPAQYSTLWEKDSPSRPRFDPSFWGEGGIDRIHAETGGWPHLVQLVAETCIDLLNAEGLSAVDGALLERAFQKAVARGEAVFYELLRRESTVPGEGEYLEGFARAEELPLPVDAAVARALRRRELLVTDGDRCRLRAPILRRWLQAQFV